MSNELERREERPSLLRPPIGLLLSIGDIVPTADGKGTRPAKIDYFRAKPGQLEQYAHEAERFHQVYGAEPKQLDDVFFLSDLPGDVLDIRLRWWGLSGLKGIGFTNYATLPPDEFEQRVDAWDDQVIAFLDNQPDPVEDRLKGPDDARIAKYGMKVYTTLRFCLPEIVGIGRVVEITTTSKRSRGNLYQAVWDAQRFLQGHLVGLPFRLSVRPARSRYWDEKQKKRASTSFYELVLDSALTWSEIIERVHQRRAALEGGVRRALPAPDTGGSAEARNVAERSRVFADNPERMVEEAADVEFVPVEVFDPVATSMVDDDGQATLDMNRAQEEEDFSFEQLVPESAKPKTRGVKK